MIIDVRAGDVLAEPSALAVIPVVEGEALPDAIARLIEAEDIPTKPNQTRLVYTRGAVAPSRVLLAGMGARDTIDAERVRQVAATVVRTARDLQVADITIGGGPLPIDAATAGEALALGLELGAYRYLRHKTGLSEAETFEVASVTVVTDAPPELAEGIAVGRTVAAGVLLARDLVNTPPEHKTPPKLADRAVRLGEEVAGLTVEVFDEQRLEAEGFGGILAVGKGSDSPPRFIVMEYGAQLTDVPTICLVGKGLTFDSGGYNVKPEDGMLNMKNDMGGSAAVFGCMQVIAELQLPVHVVGLVPSAENMISGRAYRPGDVITSLSGKTMEILNTDAEGRVILSDGLFYAQRYSPDAIIEFSTLTGAIIVALGSVATGVIGTDQALVDALLAAGEASGDRGWQLPLWDDYREMIKGDVGDIKNLAGRAAGSITAGAFLAEFVGDHPFVHLDIAGTAWLDSPSKPYQFRGGTGAGVRLVTQYLRSLAG
jgi:leucyl aminopeptidase